MVMVQFCLYLNVLKLLYSCFESCTIMRTGKRLEAHQIVMVFDLVLGE